MSCKPNICAGNVLDRQTGRQAGRHAHLAGGVDARIALLQPFSGCGLGLSSAQGLSRCWESGGSWVFSSPAFCLKSPGRLRMISFFWIAKVPNVRTIRLRRIDIRFFLAALVLASRGSRHKRRLSELRQVAQSCSCSC